MLAGSAGGQQAGRSAGAGRPRGSAFASGLRVVHVFMVQKHQPVRQKFLRRQELPFLVRTLVCTTLSGGGGAGQHRLR